MKTKVSKVSSKSVRRDLPFPPNIRRKSDTKNNRPICVVRAHLLVYGNNECQQPFSLSFYYVKKEREGSHTLLQMDTISISLFAAAGWWLGGRQRSIKLATCFAFKKPPNRKRQQPPISETARQQQEENISVSILTFFCVFSDLVSSSRLQRNLTPLGKNNMTRAL